MAAVPGYLLVSLIFDWAIFVREIAIIALIGGIVGGGILIAALKILARRSNITGQNKILIEHIQYIALVENGTIRPPEVRIAFQGSNEQNLQFRILRLPYQWMNGMDDELHAAEEVFSKKGVEIRKVES